MLGHIHKNIPDNINLADVANKFVDREDISKQTFRHFSQNFSLFKTKLILSKK